MKKAVIYYKDTYNIGDTIQTLAASRLIGGADLFLDREDLNNYKGEEAKLLCNGYFMKEPMNWPPSDKLHPLYIAFHISGYYEAEKYILDRRLKNYYNQYSPIGCRDISTAERFKSIGVDSYYSSCLTLTLNFEEDIESSGEILFVDPFLKMNSSSYEKYIIDKMVPDSLRHKVDYVKHDMDIKKLSVHERLPIAEALLRRYAAADIVITSRIHCALPCLALGTPVYYVDVGYDRPEARKRLTGILDLMHVLDQNNFPSSSSKPVSKLFRKTGLYKLNSTSDLKKLIDWDHVQNKQEPIDKFKASITKRVKDFFND